MSEYSYYEFQAIDRQLTAAERQELRLYSSRASITASRFSNYYNWGDFRGNPAEWVVKYFDAYFYMANWRTRQLSFRLPKRLLDPNLARQYCCGELASLRVKGGCVILDFFCEDGEWDDYSDDGSGWLSALAPLRADVIAGDHRLLYLGWLYGVQLRLVPKGAPEPPVPAGLGDLTPALDAFVDLFKIDRDLIAAAAQASPRARPALSSREIQSQVAALSSAEKVRWLVRLAGGQEPHLREEFVKELSHSSTAATSDPRTVAAIRAAAGTIRQERERLEAMQAAAERAQRERAAAEARDQRLVRLAKREAEAWRKVDALIATRQPGKYDEAVALLLDLREISVRKGREAKVEAKLHNLLEAHARKSTLVDRLRKAGLVKLGSRRK